jgi:ubiquinone/menaquinone biosynthesis C-methylase UbiE
MPVNYHSRIVRRESRQAAALVARHVGHGTTVLDVGCGEGYVAAELGARGAAVELVDIVDVRRTRDQAFGPQPFRLFDGLNLPFPDASFDVVMLNFVLHHVPDDRKAHLLKEAARVSRDKVFILEDTPRNVFDRLMNRRHGRRYRDKIGSHAPFGFLTRREWEWLFKGLGFLLRETRILGRFCRAPWQPFARSAFLLQVRG